MQLSLIAALAKNNAIGYNNRLLCYLPADLQHFKKLTTGHTILMGRKTFESLPNGALPNRKNVVISSQSIHYENCIGVKNIKEALEISKNENEIFVIGGESVYRQTIEIADTLYITHINSNFPADSFFPEIAPEIWQETAREDFSPDEHNHFIYSFVRYERK